MSDCIEHEGGRSGKGYGYVGTHKYGTRFAHRVAWIEAHGPIPDGLLVCHTCDNPPCINLDHLFLGTVRDNALDMIAKGRDYRDPPRFDELSAARLRRAHATGSRAVDLAELHGVSVATIYNVTGRCGAYA